MSYNNEQRIFLSQQYTDNLDETIQQSMTSSLIRLALFSEAKRTHFTKDDIVQTIKHRQSFDAIYASANSTLAQLFGLEIKQLVGHEKEGMTQPKVSNNYILCKIVSTEDGYAETEMENLNLLTLILALIHTSGRKIKHDALSLLLQKLDLSLDSSNEYFGSMTDLMNLFVKSGFLDRFKVGESFTYTWGPRAKAIWSDSSIMEYLKSFYPEFNETMIGSLETSIQRSADNI